MPDSPSPTPTPPTPDYGLDAPGAVRNLFIAAGVGLLSWLTFKAHLWSGVLDLGPLSFPLGRMGLGAALVCGFMGRRGWPGTASLARFASASGSSTCSRGPGASGCWMLGAGAG